MWRDVRFIAVKDLRYMLRERATLVWVFVMPVVFFFFIGTVTGGFAPDPGAEDAGDPLVVVASVERDGFLVEQLVKRLSDRGFAVTVTDSTHVIERYKRALHVPVGFTDSVLVGEPVTLRARLEDEGFGGSFDDIRVKRAAYTLLADVIVAAVKDSTAADPSAGALTVTREALLRLEHIPRSVTLDVRPAGSRGHIPTGFEQAVPGIMVMFTLLVMGTSGAILLVVERRQGLLRRLASAPITRTSVVAGKWLGKLALGLVQIAFAMITGTLLFGMDWGSNVHAVLGVMVAYAALMAAVGLLLGTIARTEGQAAAIGVISANVLGALGGCWWPIEVAAPWMQDLQLLLPTGWAMNALHALVSFGAPPATVIPHVIGMSVACTLLLGVTGRLFRYE